MCPRCNGYLTRDKGFEFATQSHPAYHCVNCGAYYDLCIMKNQRLTQDERSHLVTNTRVRHAPVGDDTYALLVTHSLFLDHGVVSSWL